MFRVDTHLKSIGYWGLLSAAALSGCGSSDSGKGGGGGASGASSSGGTSTAGGASSSGGASGASSSGGAGGSAGSSGAAGASGATADGGAIPSGLGTPCKSGKCSPGLTPVTYCGFAGCSQGSFCSCEIPCDKSPSVCPKGTQCATVADGPGTVCVK